MKKFIPSLFFIAFSISLILYSAYASPPLVACKTTKVSSSITTTAHSVNFQARARCLFGWSNHCDYTVQIGILNPDGSFYWYRTWTDDNLECGSENDIVYHGVQFNYFGQGCVAYLRVLDNYTGTIVVNDSLNL